jgi:hypothetical protein
MTHVLLIDHLIAACKPSRRSTTRTILHRRKGLCARPQRGALLFRLSRFLAACLLADLMVQHAVGPRHQPVVLAGLLPAIEGPFRSLTIG